MPRQTAKIKLDGVFEHRKLAPPRSVWLPGGWWLWCLLGLGIGLAVWIGGRDFLRNELSTRLASAHTEQSARESIDALLRLDGDATVEVARGLSKTEFMVANAAFRALNEQLDAWSRLSPTERLRRMAKVVQELERAPDDLDQDHRILISGLASRIYAEALSNRESGAADVLAACKRILSRSPAPEPSKAVAAAGSPVPASPISASPVPASLVPGSPVPGASELPDASPVPPPLPPLRQTATGGRSPSSTTTAEMPRLSSHAGERVALSSGRATVQLTATPARQPAASEARDTADVSRSELSDETAPDATAANVSSESVPVSAMSQTSDKEEIGTLAGIDELPIDQLVRLLSSVQPRVAQAASLALRRKGMSDDKLALAMKLATGSPSEREELLQSLAQRQDLDPRPWLLWMAADGQSQVRERAVGLLSPLLDNDVRRQLRLLLTTERDQRVAQTIRQVLVQ
ncbi:MAG: hypothetical protein ACTHOU_10885 [Aureliella sp.]